jgi:hypothetical protein
LQTKVHLAIENRILGLDNTKKACIYVVILIYLLLTLINLFRSIFAASDFKIDSRVVMEAEAEAEAIALRGKLVFSS